MLQFLFHTRPINAIKRHLTFFTNSLNWSYMSFRISLKFISTTSDIVKICPMFYVLEQRGARVNVTPLWVPRNWHETLILAKDDQGSKLKISGSVR